MNQCEAVWSFIHAALFFKELQMKSLHTQNRTKQVTQHQLQPLNVFEFRLLELGFN